MRLFFVWRPLLKNIKKNWRWVTEQALSKEAISRAVKNGLCNLFSPKIICLNVTMIITRLAALHINGLKRFLYLAGRKKHVKERRFYKDFSISKRNVQNMFSWIKLCFLIFLLDILSDLIFLALYPLARWLNYKYLSLLAKEKQLYSSVIWIEKNKNPFPLFLCICHRLSSNRYLHKKQNIIQSHRKKFYLLESYTLVKTIENGLQQVKNDSNSYSCSSDIMH